ncbi:hypothetical protein ACFPPD_06760 [Cohnella suwonensis]|uniref:Uncharacterized protein n=1 Tax=Cohnella suwonensis TaxID=696072 RepID=A0ABW0LT14_9BACL
MRLLKRDQRVVVFRNRVETKDPDGTTFETWSDTVVDVRGNVQPAGGRVMAEQYGERLSYMLMMYTESAAGVAESAGAWVYVPADATEPDYKVVAVRPWRHTVIELEKVRP